MKFLDSLFERYPLFRYIPGILWMAVIFRSSAIPGDSMGWLEPPFDKVVHCFTYAALSVFFCMWFSNARWDKKPLLWGGVCALMCAAFGALDEFHQSFVPGRDVSLGDIGADFVGGVLGAAVYGIFKPWRRFRIFKK